MTQRSRKTGRCRVWLCQATLVLVSLTGVLACGNVQTEKQPGGNAGAARLVLQSGHTRGVYSAVLAPDGQTVLTAGDHGAILWNAATGHELRRFHGHTGEVLSAVFSPNGRLALTASSDMFGDDYTARLWDVTTGRELHRLSGHTKGRNLGQLYAGFSPDGHTILTVLTGDKTVRLWEVATGRELRRFSSDTDKTPVFAPDGRTILTVSDDGSARLWEVATGRELRRFSSDTDKTPVFAPDGRTILTVSDDGSARLWEVATGRELHRFNGDIGRIPVFAPDGHTILTVSYKGTPSLWDAATGQVLHRFEGHTNVIASAVFSPDGRKVLTASDDQTARLWDAKTGREIHRLGDTHTDDVRFAVFAPDGHTVLTVSKDHIAHLWEVANGHELRHFKGHTASVSSAVFSPTDHTLLTTSWDHTARLWDMVTGQELRQFEGHHEGVTAAIFAPDGRTMMTASRDETVRLWDVTSGRELVHLWVPFGGVNSTVFYPNGRAIITASGDTAYLWQTDLETATEDGTQYAYQTAQMRLLRRFTGHTLDVNSAVFSLDGKTVLTASWDKTARLWDTDTGRELRRFEGHTAVLGPAVFSPNGDMILTAGTDGTARLHEMATGKELRRFAGHTDDVISAIFSPDGHTILTTSEDHTTRLWNAETGGELARLVSFKDGTWVVATPDGRFDTNNLEESKRLHWLMPDDPLRALPLEIFMRDYRKSKLLPKVLAEQPEEFKPVRPLQELNRAQPKVLGIEVVPGSEAGRVDVAVKVAAGEYENATTRKKHYSSVHDLRLFRDGQLVGQWPEPKEGTPDGVSGAELAQWQTDTQVVPANGRTRVTFRGIRLPHRGNKEAVEFSAYAFNEDRVKGETVRTTTPAAAGPVTKRAYLVAIGVDDYGDDRWNLRYATKDASAMTEALVPRLQQAGYEPQVNLLVSGAMTKQATKEQIYAAIEGVVGRSTPDDLVILFFSGHGYSGKREAFYLLPGDSRPSQEPNWRRPAQASLMRTISAEELSGWMRKVVAAEIVLIIDACHSAASVEGGGFQPGPLGSKGLGQLAYDKRMRVLAASQSNQAAREMGGQIGAGVLTYALVHDALQAKQAADEHGTITLKRWLEYPVTRVPQLFEEIRAKKVNDYGVAVTKDAIPPGVQGTMTQKGAVQVPVLFDYARGTHSGVVLQGVAKTGQ